MSGDAFGATESPIESSRTRRIQSFNGPGKEEQIANEIRRHIERLNQLFVEAKKVGLQVEVGALSGPDMSKEIPDPDSDSYILIRKLRIEKDF